MMFELCEIESLFFFLIILGINELLTCDKESNKK